MEGVSRPQGPRGQTWGGQGPEGRLLEQQWEAVCLHGGAQAGAGPGSQRAEAGNFQALEPSPPQVHGERPGSPGQPLALNMSQQDSGLGLRGPQRGGDTQVSSAKNSLHSAPTRTGRARSPSPSAEGGREGGPAPSDRQPRPRRGLSRAPLGFGSREDSTGSWSTSSKQGKKGLCWF